MHSLKNNSSSNFISEVFGRYEISEGGESFFRTRFTKIFLVKNFIHRLIPLPYSLSNLSVFWKGWEFWWKWWYFLKFWLHFLGVNFTVKSATKKIISSPPVDFRYPKHNLNEFCKKKMIIIMYTFTKISRRVCIRIAKMYLSIF